MPGEKQSRSQETSEGANHLPNAIFTWFSKARALPESDVEASTKLTVSGGEVEPKTVVTST